MKNVVHIAQIEKFIPSFITLVRDELSHSSHKFITYGKFNDYPYDIKEDSIHLESKANKLSTYISRYVRIAIEINRCDKIVLHGLSDIYIVILLFFNPWLLKKCHWFIWGGDLYKYNRELYPEVKFYFVKEIFRKFVIKRLGYLVSYLSDDIEIARKIYGARGEYQECIMYLSNTISTQHRESASYLKCSPVKILLGNSADPKNNHISALNKLLPFKDDNIEIIIPLSYGNRYNAALVEEYAVKKFGSKVKVLTDFLPYSEYLILLRGIDVTILNHDRQQAMGNTISLLGMGKKVYLKRGTSQWNLFMNLGVEVFDIEKLDLKPVKVKNRNVEIVSNYFSKKNLVKQLFNITR